MSHGDHMGHSGMDHAGMDHSGMDHSGMDHSGMDHSGMDHSGHNMAMAVVNSTMKAIVDAMQATTEMDHSGHGGMDHGDHSGHGGHSGHGDHAGHSGHGGHDSHMGAETHMMSMSFHFGVSETILFDWWKTTNVGGLIGSMIGIFIMALLYEGLKYWREHLFRKSLAAMQYCAKVERGNLGEDNKNAQMNMLSADHGIQTLLHVVQMIVSYFLMLIFMTYNVWLCIAVVLGAAVGYFLFGWRKSVVVDITEHCH